MKNAKTEGMQKKSKMVRCTFLNGSISSIEKKYMRRYKVQSYF